MLMSSQETFAHSTPGFTGDRDYATATQRVPPTPQRTALPHGDSPRLGPTFSPISISPRPLLEPVIFSLFLTILSLN